MEGHRLSVMSMSCSFFPKTSRTYKKTQHPVITGRKRTTLDETHVYTQVRSYLPLPHISFRPALWVCSKGFKAAVTERKGEGGREVSREGKGLRGGSWQRSLAVGESQRGAYHCLSLIHHDRDRGGLNNWEREGDRGENRGRGANTETTGSLRWNYRTSILLRKQNNTKEYPFKI